jgi:Secretion system C-terminal sorting domain/Beta-propeller repeat
MKKTLLSICLFITTLTNAQTATWLWANKIDYNTTSVGITKTSIGPSGEVVAIGSYGNNIVIGTTTLTSSLNTAKVYVAKYDVNGNPLWATSIGTNSLTICKSVKIDGSGNVYVAGCFFGSTACQSLSLTATTGTIANAGDAFIIKYNSTGIVQWFKKFGTGRTDFINTIDVDNSGNIYAAAIYSTSSSINADPTDDYGRLEILKLDPSGTIIWQVTGNNYQNFTNSGVFHPQLKCSKQGNIIVSGDFNNNFAIQTNTFVFTTSRDAFWLKLDNAGTLLNKKVLTSPTLTSKREISGLALDSLENSYLIGKFYLNSHFDTYSVSAAGNVNYQEMLVKLSPTGTGKWANTFKVVAGVGGNIPNDIGVDNLGKVRVIGNTNCNGVVFGTYTLMCSPGGSDYYLATYDTAGVYVSVNNSGYVKPDGASSISVEKNGDFVLGGTFSSFPVVPMVFGTFTLTPPIGINSNVFLVKNGIGSVPTEIKNNNPSNNTIKIMPNPVKNYFEIASEVNGKLELTDISGRLIRSYEIGNANLKIDISDLNSGLYLVRGFNSKGIFTAKLIKE